MRGRNRRSGETAKGSPHWMTTYSDMVTLLLCFFALMYAFSNIDVQKFRAIMSSLQGSLGVMQGGRTISDAQALGNAPVDQEMAAPDLASQEIEEIQQLYERLSEFIADQGLESTVVVKKEERGVVLSFSESALFDLGKADLTPRARTTLGKLADVFAELPNHIRVEGHADNWSINTSQFPSNWELSTARATNVVRFLIEEHGISPYNLSAAGYGEYRPIAPNDTAENRARNRRVDIVVLRESIGRYEPSPKVPDSR